MRNGLRLPYSSQMNVFVEYTRGITQDFSASLMALKSTEQSVVGRFWCTLNMY